MHISELQERIKNDWKNNSTLQPTREQKLLFVIEEFGEVAEAIRKRSAHHGDYKTDDGSLGTEFADLFISLTTLANEYEVNLEQEIEGFWDKLEKRRNS